MAMWNLSAIGQRIVGLALAIALVVAPVAPALADCAAAKPVAGHTAATMPPCDTPCQDCATKAEKKSCQGDCICVTAMLSFTPVAMAGIALAQQPAPHAFSPHLTLAHPPDTPPPRTLLV